MDALQSLTNSGVLEGLSAASSVGSGIMGNVAARRNASTIEDVGALMEGESLRESARLLGAQRAAYAKAGVDIASGTPLDVLAETAQNEAMNALRLRYGYRARAYDERLAGTASLTGGLLQGATTGITAYNRRQSLLPKQRYRTPRSGEGFAKAPRLK